MKLDARNKDRLLTAKTESADRVIGFPRLACVNLIRFTHSRQSGCAQYWHSRGLLRN